ncbi:MAG: hypothetical protein QG618_398, partial [Thermodesulfobacteriota bacterium]|nr:hypothetical protein [Thermodesulfobacteriota bacterium]
QRTQGAIAGFVGGSDQMDRILFVDEDLAFMDVTQRRLRKI